MSDDNRYFEHTDPWPGQDPELREELLEDKDGAPYPEKVQEFVHWLRVGIASATGLVEAEMAKPGHGDRDKLVSLATTQAVYQEVLDKVKELA